jgi:hypothetical protein
MNLKFEARNSKFETNSNDQNSKFKTGASDASASLLKLFKDVLDI